jgi:subtilisin family serine protease
MRESSQSSVRSPKIEKPNRSSLNVIKPQSTADKDPTAKTIRSDYGIRADKAWANNHFSDPDTFIGIVDTGIQFSHRDLKGNIWNGIGKDFYSFSPIPITTWDPVDDAHGTHVAGIIAAVGNNGKGIVGVAWRAKLIIAKFMGPNHWATTEAAVGAIDYLTDLKENHGFHIVAINLSWVGAGQDKALLRAIKHAGRDEILCVVAAGNYHLNNDKDLVYPANFDTSRDNIDNTGRLAFNSIISVAAIKPDGTLADFSDYGRSTVHIAAPGMDIVSTWPNDTYRLDSGTSSSAAFVSGAIALYASSHPGAGARDIRKAILDTATPVAALKGLVATGGTLNVSTF